MYCSCNPLKSLSISALLLYIVPYICGASSFDATSTNTSQWIDELCSNFGENVVTRARNLSAGNQLKQLYDSVGWTPEALKPNATLNNASTAVGNLFKLAEDLVERLAEQAEARNHHKRAERLSIALSNKNVRFYNKLANQSSANSSEIYDENSNKTMFYYNSKCVCGHQLKSGSEKECYVPEEGFTASPLFAGINISHNTSAVHIPVDVFNEGEDVLRDIAWSQDLDEFWTENVSKFSKVKWSYISTLSGVTRYFPASPWNLTCHNIDLYDGRSIHWFVQSMSSPKDVVIMIDTSGSVVGLTLNLVRMSVTHVLRSLVSNDYFNVIVFNKNATFLNPGCVGLLPATPINKEMVVSWLDSLQVGNASLFNRGFNFAFNVLNMEEKDFKSAECNPVILLFTDGGAEYPGALFERRNGEKKTRIFTYSVGKHFSSVTSLKQMACNNKGTFTTIPSDSATHFQTMEYLVQLSRPLAESAKKYNKWSLPYEDHLGLGTVLSVSRPFFDNYLMEEPHRHVNKVAGIAGVDILYSDVRKLLDGKQWGANSYFFGIDNNGYLFYHPLLKRGRLDAPVMIDVLDMEHADVEQLRKSMINKYNEFNVKRSKQVLSVDKEHVTTAYYYYSYIHVSKPSNSLFSLAFAYPEVGKYMMRISSTSSCLDVLNVQKGYFTAIYGFTCKNNAIGPSLCADDNIDNSFEINDQQQLQAACDQLEFSSEFLLHAEVTSDLERSWPVLSKSALAAFVATDSSPELLRIRHFGDANAQTSITTSLSNPSSKDYFIRALLASSASPVVFTLIDVAEDDVAPTTPTSTEQYFSIFDPTTSFYQQQPTTASTPQNQKSKQIVISEAVNSTQNGTSLRPAVSGVVMDYEYIKEVLFNLSREPCDGSDKGCNLASDCWNKDRLCVLLDDGGILFVSNQDAHESHVGKFFGYCDRDLMDALERDSVYDVIDIDDHQVVCESDDNGGNSGRSMFLIPTISSILNSGYWITSSLLLSLQSFCALLFTTIREVTSQSFQTYPFKRDEFVFPNYNSKKVHCVVRKKIYTFSHKTKAENMTESCERMFAAKRIPDTNLLFVIADINQSCSATCRESDRYSVVTNQTLCPSNRFRKEPNWECSDARTESNSPNIGDDGCGCSHLAPGVFLIIFLVIIQWICPLQR